MDAPIDDKTYELKKKVERLIPLRVNVYFDCSCNYERLDTHQKGIEKKFVKLLSEKPIEVKYDEKTNKIKLFSDNSEEFLEKANALILVGIENAESSVGYYAQLYKKAN